MFKSQGDLADSQAWEKGEKELIVAPERRDSWDCLAAVDVIEEGSYKPLECRSRDLKEISTVAGAVGWGRHLKHLRI